MVVVRVPFDIASVVADENVKDMLADESQHEPLLSRRSGNEHDQRQRSWSRTSLLYIQQLVWLYCLELSVTTQTFVVIAIHLFEPSVFHARTR